jgi:hypothetical protein
MNDEPRDIVTGRKMKVNLLNKKKLHPIELDLYMMEIDEDE